MRTRVALALSAALLALVPRGTEAASSINTTLPVQGAPFNAAPIRQNFQAAANDINALQSLNAGASAPASPGLGTMWLDTSATPYLLKTWSVAGSQWVTIAGYNQTTALWMPPVGGGTIPSITSAATTNLAISPAAAVSITGNQAIASFGTVPEGQVKFLSFTGSASLVYNATYMILPGAANITMSPGSTAIAISLGGGRWRVDTSDLNGPSSAADGAVALFSGATGKVLKTGITAFPSVPGPTPTNIAYINVGSFPTADQIPAAVLQGLSVMVAIPDSYTQNPWPPTAISAYITNANASNANASAVAFFGFAGVTSDSGGTPGTVTAMNVVASNCAKLVCADGSGFNGAIAGLEVNLDYKKKGAAQPAIGAVHGVRINGGAEVDAISGSYALHIDGLNLFTTPKLPWLYGIFSEDGAATTALFIGRLTNAAADGTSQSIAWRARSGGANKDMVAVLGSDQYLDFTGNPDLGGIRGLNVDARNSFTIDGMNVLTLGGSCINLSGETGVSSLHVCNATPQNLYRNTTHIFQTINGASSFAQLDAGGIQVNVAGTAIATNATGPFLYTSAGAGAPTGAPTHAAAGRAAIYVDTTNHTICFYEQPTTTWTCK